MPGRRAVSLSSYRAPGQVSLGLDAGEPAVHDLLIVWGRGRSAGRLPGSSPTRRYARPRPGPVVRLLSCPLHSGTARSARTRDRAERDVDDPALLGHVGTALVALEDLRERRPQGAQLFALFGLNGLDLHGVAEAFEQLAELDLAFLRSLLPGRELLRPGWLHQLLGLRVADLQRTILHSCWLRPAVAAGQQRHDRWSR